MINSPLLIGQDRMVILYKIMVNIVGFEVQHLINGILKSGRVVLVALKFYIIVQSLHKDVVELSVQ
jgi:hypothetical protein